MKRTYCLILTIVLIAAGCSKKSAASYVYDDYAVYKNSYHRYSIQYPIEWLAMDSIVIWKDDRLMVDWMNDPQQFHDDYGDYYSVLTEEELDDGAALLANIDGTRETLCVIVYREAEITEKQLKSKEFAKKYHRSKIPDEFFGDELGYSVIEEGRSEKLGENTFILFKYSVNRFNPVDKEIVYHDAVTVIDNRTFRFRFTHSYDKKGMDETFYRILSTLVLTSEPNYFD